MRSMAEYEWLYDRLDRMVERGEIDESEARAELRDYIQDNRRTLWGEETDG